MTLTSRLFLLSMQLEDLDFFSNETLSCLPNNISEQVKLYIDPKDGFPPRCPASKDLKVPSLFRTAANKYDINRQQSQPESRSLLEDDSDTESFGACTTDEKDEHRSSINLL